MNDTINQVGAGAPAPMKPQFTTVVIRDAKDPIQLGNLLLGGVISAAATGNLVEEQFQREAAAPAAPADYERMFRTAVGSLIAVGEAAGVRAEDQLNGAAEIICAIETIKARRDSWRRRAELAEAALAAPAAPAVQAEQEPVGHELDGLAGDLLVAADLVRNKAVSSRLVEYSRHVAKLAYCTPAPDAVLVEALRNLLSDDDIRHLRRFQEICEDSDADGHDLPKEAVRRLERAGTLRACGFGRHETTLFGDAILAALAGKGGE